ncbi:response regulator transcription factor [Patescibacteria group bacterium]|nr:MAG: response regulator transcription factor [Patescibacteria group bacterium]
MFMPNDSKPKIMIIEDDRFITQVYSTKLKEVGFDLAMVADGRDAVPAILNEKPDLVILDLMLPGKSGFDILRERMNSDELKKVPVIVITALAQSKEREMALSLGAQDYIIKSDHSIQEIMQKILKHCERCGIVAKNIG